MNLRLIMGNLIEDSHQVKMKKKPYQNMNHFFSVVMLLEVQGKTAASVISRKSENIIKEINGQYICRTGDGGRF